MTSAVEFLDALKKAKDEKRAAEEREWLSHSYMDFVRHAWHTLKPHEPFIDNWHLEAIAKHLEAVSRGEIHRLQIWIPPGSMKTGMCTVFWPAWEWTTRPWLRYFTVSYEQHLAQRFSLDTQQVVRSEWYQQRWPTRLVLDAASYWKNDQGGSRFATTPKSVGTGEHGHRIIIDDPLPARAVEGDLGVDLKTAIVEVNEKWYDSTMGTRVIDNAEKGFYHARIIVMQRLHENDLAAHVLEQEEWVVLSLPERFWKANPYAWRGRNIHPAVRPHLPPLLEHGDPRAEGELLWPARRNEEASNALAKQLTSLRAPAQLQQWPSPREGNLLKREWWRFYDPRIRAKEQWHALPRFGMIVISVDTPLKDKESNDYVAIQCWGVAGADRYLLDLRKGHMNYSASKRQIREMAQWSRRVWRRVPNYILIENAGYGVELIEDLKRELTGIIKISPSVDGDKIARAQAASDALESGNCFLPGYGPPWQPAYDEHRTPAEIVDFISSCAAFPQAAHDDDVDAWSQAQNWLRGRFTRPARGSSVLLSRRR